MAYENWTLWIEFAGWVDVTADVDSFGSPINATGGETAETADASGGMSLRLHNTDHRYTPGNRLSPYYPYVKSGRRIRLTETIAGVVYELFTGRLSWPELETWVSASTTAPRDQTITLSATDLIVQANTTSAYVSTLAAHIRGRGGTALAGYWPLLVAAAPVQSLPAGSPLAEWDSFSASPNDYNPTDPALPSITYQGGTPVPGDDVAPVDLQPSRDLSTFSPSVFYVASRSLRGSISITLGVGQVMTLVGWCRADEETDLTPGSVLQVFDDAGTFGAFISWSADQLTGGADAADWTGTSPATTTTIGFGRWVPVGLRFGFSPAVHDVWIGADVYTGSMSVTTPTPVTAEDLRVGSLWRGSLAHIQIYVGAEDDWDHDDFLAQREVGLYGLDRQTTGQRIRTIAGYLGIADADLIGVDDGVTVMTRARLAGMTPGAAWAEAAETEQGSLYANGSGRLVFDDRRTLYNV